MQGRSDQPVITAFIQGQINAFESTNACRSDGSCNEACNTGGFVKDPDCVAAHCGQDGLCSQACVNDPDCGGGGTGGSGGSGGGAMCIGADDGTKDVASCNAMNITPTTENGPATLCQASGATYNVTVATQPSSPS